MGIKKETLEVNVSIEEIKNVLYFSFCKLIFSNWICLICKMRNIANVLKILKPNKSPGEAEVISGITNQRRILSVLHGNMAALLCSNKDSKCTKSKN
jgi:hypothetical protein